MAQPDHEHGLDLVGIGTVAKAIPPEVYTRTATTVLETFEKLIAPITETTHGFGLYVRQKFSNMVEVERAIATHTLELAVRIAKEKAKLLNVDLTPPAHPKTFIKSLEEASKETDHYLNRMWANLIAGDLLPQGSHPHFVEILTHFSSDEARLLASLNEIASVGEHAGGYMLIFLDTMHHWVRHAGDKNQNLWTMSCTLLVEFGFAELLSTKNEDEKNRCSILYRTKIGTEFLKAVGELAST